MSEEEYKEDAANIIIVGNRINAVAHFVDMRELYFPTPPHLQNWVLGQVVPHVQKTLKRNAMLLSNDFVPSINIQQIVDEMGGSFQTRYFNSEEAAYTWLLEALEV
jgi:hypothetical protein